VNKKLLVSKSEVEYRLMEALAQLPGSADDLYLGDVANTSSFPPAHISSVRLRSASRASGHAAKYELNRLSPPTEASGRRFQQADGAYEEDMRRRPADCEEHIKGAEVLESRSRLSGTRDEAMQETAADKGREGVNGTGSDTEIRSPHLKTAASLPVGEQQFRSSDSHERGNDFECAYDFSGKDEDGCIVGIGNADSQLRSFSDGGDHSPGGRNISA
jgi:hypothetical protein